ncbi:MAG: hypothetical protein IJS32_07770 [Kiritimatiellae bacterium]|nr:hypothetical protein [Kiritimatiellia bacterium]
MKPAKAGIENFEPQRAQRTQRNFPQREGDAEIVFRTGFTGLSGFLGDAASSRVSVGKKSHAKSAKDAKKVLHFRNLARRSVPPTAASRARGRFANVWQIWPDFAKHWQNAAADGLSGGAGVWYSTISSSPGGNGPFPFRSPGQTPEFFPDFY